MKPVTLKQWIAERKQKRQAPLLHRIRRYQDLTDISYVKIQSYINQAK